MDSVKQQAAKQDEVRKVEERPAPMGAGLRVKTGVRAGDGPPLNFTPPTLPRSPKDLSRP